ncbi:MAG TPA: translesion error-prone DNA polymerase V autoproteolytic subunit [Blastocatellia bacterium]|nr:translesion error-prone DNA polymerase V autoproteolytic subunit [Blastocatellia bacterium]
MSSRDSAGLRISSNVSAILSASTFIRLSRPLFLSRVPAGWPSPSEHYAERLDLNSHLMKHPTATFFARVEGDSMIGAGIHDGDLLVVDKAEEAGDGHVVVARIDDEICIKRLRIIDGGVWLYSENPEYLPIEITAEMEFQVWGRVMYVIHKP